MDLAERTGGIEPRIGTSPWADHEYVRGYAVMVLPFSSGDLLGLRVWKQSDFGPFVSVWHRSPDGEWSLFNDGPSLETTCPRYWSSAVQRAELADVDVTWTGPNELRVEMEEPRLVWTMTMSAPLPLRGLNAMSSLLPLRSWKPAPLLRVREWMAKRFLGMGDLRFSFTMPNGHDTVIMPEEVFFIGESEAVLNGCSLGEPVRLETNPTIGDVPLPIRPTFVLGQAHMRITNPEEYRRAREESLQYV
jgi:hypothetical protein